MSNETDKKQQPAPAPKKPGAISHLWFTMAFDFPGTQETHITCSPEPKSSGSSYVATYIREDACFEVEIHQGGKLAGVRYIPREHVKQYTRA